MSQAIQKKSAEMSGPISVNLGAQCPACGAIDCWGKSRAGELYRHCSQCSYELRESAPPENFIVNDRLDKDQIKKSSGLERFKLELVTKIAHSRKLLIDIGCASGKFLFLAQGLFDRRIGLEVTDECIQFARNELNLEIIPDLDKLEQTISVATFWHTAEHIPLSTLSGILRKIRDLSDPDTRVVISVPNSQSFQYLIFGKCYAYYDPSSHISQFSPNSLQIVLGNAGFEIERTYFSWPYSSFGYLQGLLNLVNHHHNYLYYRLKRGWDFGLSPGKLKFLDLYNFALMAIFIPFALIGSLFDLAFKDSAGAYTASFKREGRSPLV